MDLDQDTQPFINAITEYISQITEHLGKKTTCISIYIDLSKAFDTIDHFILLNKLKHCAIRGTCLKWLR
jgi:hypothetical protein